MIFPEQIAKMLKTSTGKRCSITQCLNAAGSGALDEMAEALVLAVARGFVRIDEEQFVRLPIEVEANLPKDGVIGYFGAKGLRLA